MYASSSSGSAERLHLRCLCFLSLLPAALSRHYIQCGKKKVFNVQEVKFTCGRSHAGCGFSFLCFRRRLQCGTCHVHASDRTDCALALHAYLLGVFVSCWACLVLLPQPLSTPLHELPPPSYCRSSLCWRRYARATQLVRQNCVVNAVCTWSKARMSTAAKTLHWVDMSDDDTWRLHVRSCLLFCTTRCLFLLQDSPWDWQNFCYNYTRAFCRQTVSTPAPASMRCISVVILFGVCDVIAVFCMFARLAQVGYVVIDSQPLSRRERRLRLFATLTETRSSVLLYASCLATSGGLACAAAASPTTFARTQEDSPIQGSVSGKTLVVV